jgi:membrane associated rhomboid family serine protease
VIPVGDFLRRRSTPYVNWTIIAINFAVFAWMSLTYTTSAQLTDFYYDWGFVSACLAEQFGFDSGVPARQLAGICPQGQRELLQPFTAMFIHADWTNGGWLHIAGNMLFLWIFGDNVEDRVGHGRYLVFYILCGLAAAATQTAFTVDAVEPAIGASGAVAGVQGAYLVMFPTAVIQVVILPFFFYPFFMPAVFLIGVWFLTQLVYGIGELGREVPGAGIAWWAHIGGFLGGAVLVLFFRQARRRRYAREQFMARLDT